MTTVPARTGHTARLPALIALGVVFWFVAVMFIRFVGPVAFVPGSAGLAVLYAATLPIVGVLIWLGALLSGARGPAMLPAFTVMSIVAMLLDGVAITWFPALYGLPPAGMALVGAWLLWGVAWILMLSAVLGQRAGRARA